MEPLSDDNEKLEMDETKFLLSNPANKTMLLKAKAQIEEGNVIEVSWDNHHKILEDLKELRVK